MIILHNYLIQKRLSEVKMTFSLRSVSFVYLIRSMSLMPQRFGLSSRLYSSLFFKSLTASVICLSDRSPFSMVPLSK